MPNYDQSATLRASSDTANAELSRAAIDLRLNLGHARRRLQWLVRCTHSIVLTFRVAQMQR